MNGLYNLEIFDVELMLYSELPRNIQVKARFKRHSLHVGQTLSVERKRTHYFTWQYVKIIFHNPPFVKFCQCRAHSSLEGAHLPLITSSFKQFVYVATSMII